MNPRDEELVARHLLAHPDEVDRYLKERRWAEVAALVRYANKGVPHELAMTDPALYRTLREQVTVFYLRGGGAFSLPTLEKLADNSQPSARDIALHP